MHITNIVDHYREKLQCLVLQSVYKEDSMSQATWQGLGNLVQMLCQPFPDSEALWLCLLASVLDSGWTMSILT